MALSPVCYEIFMKLITSYKTSQDQDHSQIYAKLQAIHKEIKTNPDIYSDESLIVRLSSSALILSENNPQFSHYVRDFLDAYQQKTNSLNLLADYTPKSSNDNAEVEEEAPPKEQSISNSRFFREIKIALEAHRQRMNDPNVKSKFLSLP